MILLLSSLTLTVPLGREDDVRRRQGTESGPRSVHPLLLPKGGQRQLFYLDAFAAAAVGAQPPPSRDERYMTSDQAPYNVGNFATSELYGAP